MKKFVSMFLAASALLSLSPVMSPASEQNPIDVSVQVIGKVKTEGGRGLIAGVTVEFRREDDPSIVITTTAISDSNGDFSFSIPLSALRTYAVRAIANPTDTLYDKGSDQIFDVSPLVNNPVNLTIVCPRAKIID